MIFGVLGPRFAAVRSLAVKLSAPFRLRLREIVVELNDVDRVVLVVGARDRIQVRVDISRAIRQRQPRRLLDPSRRYVDERLASGLDCITHRNERAYLPAGDEQHVG